jgi:hypothetical protein
MLNNIAVFLGEGGGAANSYESIQTYTVGAGGQATISFTSIPSTYKHLQIRALSRITSASEINLAVGFNSDTGSNYTGHYLYGDGSNTASAALGPSIAPPFAIRTSNSNATSGVFGGAVMDILDYANTNKYKTVRTLSGVDNNGSGSVFFVSSLWMSTNAISRVDITTSALIGQYSSFALYGIKG